MKNEIVKFRCSLFEKKLLKIKAKKSGINLSEFCRRSALDVKIIERLSEEHIQLYKMLINYHNNFKSIGNLYKNKDPKLIEEINRVTSEIKFHLTQFKK